jgi:signal peptide peptidase SppA
MRYPRLFHKLYFSPLMIDAAQRQAIERALQAHIAARAPIGPADNEARKTDKKGAQARIAGIVENPRADTQIIHMDGIIDKNLSAFEMECYGGYDLNDLNNALAEASQNPAIKNVLLAVDSPGGNVTGVPESAARVAALSQMKNVFAYTEGLCCSAAYFIASQADQIFSTSSAVLGSIGVYLALLDESRALEMQGYSVDLMKAGKYKAAGSGFQPLTDEERAIFQGQVDKIYGMFTGAVRAKRPNVNIETMQGQSFFGDDAVYAGLSDRIVSSISDVLGEF